MNSQEPDVVLVDEEGVEHRFYLYQVVEVEGNNYALLQPEHDEEELVVLRFEGDDEETQSLVSISDEEWETVVAALDGQDLDEQ